MRPFPPETKESQGAIERSDRFDDRESAIGGGDSLGARGADGECASDR